MRRGVDDRKINSGRFALRQQARQLGGGRFHRIEFPVGWAALVPVVRAALVVVEVDQRDFETLQTGTHGQVNGNVVFPLPPFCAMMARVSKGPPMYNTIASDRAIQPAAELRQWPAGGAV